MHYPYLPWMLFTYVCPARLILLHLVTSAHAVNSTNHDAPHYAFVRPCHYHPCMPKYLPQHPVQRHPYYDALHSVKDQVLH